MDCAPGKRGAAAQFDAMRIERQLDTDSEAAQ